MARGKKHAPERVVSLLRQVEAAVANGKTTPAACREGGITEQTYYRWRKEYGGLQVDQARRLKELEPLLCRGSAACIIDTTWLPETLRSFLSKCIEVTA
jgi:Transposase